jgi:hypothetical protein
VFFIQIIFSVLIIEWSLVQELIAIAGDSLPTPPQLFAWLEPFAHQLQCRLKFAGQASIARTMDYLLQCLAHQV